MTKTIVYDNIITRQKRHLNKKLERGKIMIQDNELYSIYYNIICELSEDLSVYKNITKAFYTLDQENYIINFICAFNKENIATNNLGRILERIRITQKAFNALGISFIYRITSNKIVDELLQDNEIIKNAEIFKINDTTLTYKK